MILFQWIALTIIGLILLLEIAQVARKKRVGWNGLMRLVVWIGAAIAIFQPDMVSQIASTLGIGAGSNLVLYTVTLAFIFTTFYFYSRYLRLQRQLTELARYLAIQEAKQPGTSPAQDIQSAS